MKILQIKIILAIMLAGLTLATAGEIVVNPALVRVYLLNKNDIDDLIRINPDVAWATNDYADIVAYPEDLSKIQSAGLHYEVVYPDLVRFYQSRFPTATTMGGFLTFPEILAKIDSLHAALPNIVSARDSVGYSWQGRALWVFKISDNVDIDEDEPEVFFNALTHAREPQSMQWQMNYALWLCQNYGTNAEATSLVDNHEIYFMPVVNPDGYEYNRATYPSGGGMYRKNRNPNGGVDLNRNFGFMWGYDDIGSSPEPSDETFRGTGPFSEVETQGFRDFVISRNFSFILNAHTYGDYFLYPMCYADIYSPDQPLYELLSDTVLALLGGGYTAGTPWEILYNTNGDAMDWEYADTISKPRILCATVESGTQSDGFWPSPSRIPQINAQLLPLAKYITRLSENPRAVAAPNAPVMNNLDTVRTDSFIVSWTHNDSFNPAVAFELVEKSGFSLLVDSIERGLGNWQSNGFITATNRYHSSGHSLFSQDGNMLHTKITTATPFVVRANDTLVFWTYYQIETDYDYAYVEVSTDNGLTFTPIPGNITTSTNPHNLNRGNGITGNQTTWRRAIFPLDQYVGQSIFIRFSYDTDAGTHYGGFYVDDIYPIANFANTLVLSSSIQNTSYVVRGRENGTYYYLARAQDAQSQWSSFSEPKQVVVARTQAIDDEIAIPGDFNLNQNYPNPFNSQTVISFSLASPAPVKLTIFDISGKLVRNLLNEKLGYGNHQVTWDGVNEDGKDVASGIYLYRLASGDKSITKKMMFLR
ncbi:MAG: T9SS type A sorting domain-containing protein [candidate division Zixibacteria bacterium]|jgi:hypothetical protein|nr:T9SS type A sorting domain-containing protein [candidate division Zixibacteria bacterium]